jgi:hypothetical protein
LSWGFSPFPSPGLKSLKKGGGVPRPSAEADGKGRTYSREFPVTVSTACGSSWCCGRLSLQSVPGQPFFFRRLQLQSVLSCSSSYCRRLQPTVEAPPLSWGFSPFPCPGLKSRKKGGGGAPGPSAEADGKGRTYSRELSVAVSTAHGSYWCCGRLSLQSVPGHPFLFPSASADG